MILVDSGVLIAAADVDDNHHESCARLIAERGSEFLVPSTVVVVVEVCWMLGRHVSVVLEADLLDSIAEGELQVEDPEQIDYARMSELVTTYADLAPWNGRCLCCRDCRTPRRARDRHH